MITFDDLKNKGEKVTFAEIIKMYKPDVTKEVINKWFDKAVEDSSLKLGVDTFSMRLDSYIIESIYYVSGEFLKAK